jgi:hypothetical protein
VQLSSRPGTAVRERPRSGQRRGGLAVDELEVPEFIPNL